jgi:hypothetical protein
MQNMLTKILARFDGPAGKSKPKPEKTETLAE